MTRKHISKKLVCITLAAAMSVSLFAGCGSSSSDDTRDAEAARQDNMATETFENVSEAVSEVSDAEATHSEYPVTITTYGSDGLELETTYEKAPEKVLAVYQGCIETLLALGLEDHIVATAGLDNAVPDDMKAAFSSTDYLDEFTPSKETVTMLEPDMIFSWGSFFGDQTLGDAKEWVDNGTNIYINSNTRRSTGDVSYPRTLENEYTDITNMGIIFDVQDQANAIVDEMKDTVAKVTEATSDLSERPSVLILESYDGTFWNYGSASLGGDMVTQLGAVLASDADELGKEDVIAADPDVIFIVYMPYEGDDPEALKNEKLAVINDDESLASLQAVQNKRVYPIMLSEMYASATRTQDGIVTFAEGLYPDLDLGLE